MIYIDLQGFSKSSSVLGTQLGPSYKRCRRSALSLQHLQVSLLVKGHFSQTLEFNVIQAGCLSDVKRQASSGITYRDLWDL
jgi:hypothetical protein